MTVNTNTRIMDISIGQLVTGLFILHVTAWGWSAESLSPEFDPLSMLETTSVNQQTIDDVNDMNHSDITANEPVRLSNGHISVLPSSARALSTERSHTPAEIVDTAVSGTGSEDPSPSASISDDTIDIAPYPGMLVQQQLWKAGISTTPETDNDSSKTELDRIIEQISAIEIKPQPQRQRSASPSQQAPVAMAPAHPDPNEPVSDTGSPDQPPAATENKLPDGAISPETLNQLNVLSQTPEQLKNPFQMAEILYSSGYLAEAADCYQAALDRMAGQEDPPSQDRAWMLFQLGNCLKSSHPQSAQEKYQAVIAEFPLSPWAPLAKAKSDAIAWLLKDQPVKLLEESKKVSRNQEVQ